MISLHMKGKVVIVTGASEGVGACLVDSLRRRGARIALVARNEAKLRSLASADDLVIPCDLNQDAARVEVIEKAAAHFGRIDAVINNAGRGSYYNATGTPLEDARSLFELNFFAPFHLAQLATPWLKQTKGTIVNVSSIAGQISIPWLPLYSASKFALASLSSSQRIELKQHGVNVMCVFPGYVDTDFQAHSTGSVPPATIVKGKRFAVTATECAEAIVLGIERRRSVVVTPRIGWVLVWFNRLFPALVESRMEAF
jgi:short-subunit dehydrogenase